MSAFYSMIQYCPDLARDERVNLGVILIRETSPDTVELRVACSENNLRIGRVLSALGDSWDASKDEHMTSVKAATVHRISTDISSVMDLVAYGLTRGNSVQITSPKSIRVDDMDQEIKNLLCELVE